MKLLIIDDDEEMCEEMTEILRDQGYQVATVYNGREGLARLEAEAIDVVLLDLKIPGLTGFDLLRFIKDQKHLPCKVIVLTGRPLISDPGIRIESEKIEEERLLSLADGVINKPYDVDSVLNAIRTICSSR